MRKIILMLPLFWAAAGSGLAGTPSAHIPWKMSCGGEYFVGFSLTRDALKGDLDGKQVLGNAEKAFYIPKLKPAMGFSVCFGETRKNGLWMISYSMTPHRALFDGRDGHSASHLIEVCGKAHLFSRAVVRPYIGMGFDLAWLHVAGGAIRGNTVYDANYSGLGVNARAGFYIPLNSRVFLDVGASFRFLAYIYSYGPGKAMDVTNLNINRYGPRRDSFLKVPCWRWEIGFGYIL